MVTYEFAAPLDANRSVGRFWFEIDDADRGGDEKRPRKGSVKYDNGGGGYVFPQDEVFFVPWMSKVYEVGDGSGDLEVLVVAGVSLLSLYKSLAGRLEYLTDLLTICPVYVSGEKRCDIPYCNYSRYRQHGQHRRIRSIGMERYCFPPAL